MAYARFFGASPLFSGFRIAFQIPNLARRLFGEGALASSFIPVFMHTRQVLGDGEARRLAGAVFTLLTTVLLGLLVLAEVGLLVAAQFHWGPTLSLTMILMPYMVLICTTAFFAGLLNSLNRFAAPAAAPMLLNIVIIAAAWFGSGTLGLDEGANLTFLSVAIVGAGVLQLLLQLAWLRACGYGISINVNWRAPEVRRVMNLMAPMIVGYSALQLNTFADSIIAFVLVPDGYGPSLLGYAQYMSHLPLGIFGTALATAIFPLLAQHVAERNEMGFARATETGLRAGLFIALPAGVGLMLIAGPLVRLLFASDKIGPVEVHRIVLSLDCYCVGMWAYTMQQMLVRAFHSREDSRTPVRIALAMLALNLVLNIALVLTPLQEAGVALATALTAMLQTVLLARRLHDHVPALAWRSVASTGGRCVLATLVMAAVVWAVCGLPPLRPWLPDGDLVTLMAAIVAGGGAYFGAAKALGLSEGAVLLRRRKA